MRSWEIIVNGSEKAVGGVFGVCDINDRNSIVVVWDMDG
jgi:hypothetical protein